MAQSLTFIFIASSYQYKLYKENTTNKLYFYAANFINTAELNFIIKYVFFFFDRIKLISNLFLPNKKLKVNHYAHFDIFHNFHFDLNN